MTNENKNIEIMDVGKMNESNSRGRNRKAESVLLDTQIKEEVEYCLKVVSATFLLVCFVSLKESTCETRKNVFCFSSKALFVLETHFTE